MQSSGKPDKPGERPASLMEKLDDVLEREKLLREVIERKRMRNVIEDVRAESGIKKCRKCGTDCLLGGQYNNWEDADGVICIKCGKSQELIMESIPDSTKGETIMAVVEAPKKDEKTFDMCNIHVEGDKITLPTGMSYQTAIDWIKRYAEENERVVAISEMIEAFPADGAYALTKALSQLYGWTSLIPTPGFFGDHPPAMIGIPAGPKGETVQVPWGRIQIPKVDGYIETSVTIRDGRWLFNIAGEIKRKNETEVKKIAALAREIVQKESLYKGKAIKMNFMEANPEAGFNINQECPSFIDCDLIKEEEFILNDTVRKLIDTTVLCPIIKAEQCRKYKIPLKRGILFEGPYGTGKSLAAYITAKCAERHGWTFVYLNTVTQLQKAIFFAKQYQPCVVFAEDIDRTMAGQRTLEMDEILNTIDGIDTKGADVITILTTNHVDNINPAMLRPGRLDAIVTFEKPDPKSVAKLVRMYGRELVPENLEFVEACEMMAGQIPAVIREMVERAKLAAIYNHKEGEGLELDAEDLTIAAHSMLTHVKFLEGKKFDPINTPLGQILAILGNTLGDALGKNLASVEEFKTMFAAKQKQEAEAASTNGGSALKRV